MAIYHMQAKVVSRGSGRSAVAASAYMSCSRIYNDYDGIQHDYTRKHGLIYQEVMLPPMAPPKWKNREQLWNAVEAAEKTKDSRLAREFVVALPIELDKDSNISLLQNFIQKNFVDMGMCADFAIHDTDGHNPHAHILNKYDTIKKKLKAKVTEKKELNVQKSKTSILNPFQHIKLNQQLTTVTEEIEELKSAKEQLLFQAECSTEKDMASLSRKYDQMDKNLDILDSQDMALKEQLEKDAVAFQEEKLRPKPEQYTELLDARIQIRPTFREKLIEQLKGTFGEYYDYHYRDIATHEVDDLNMEDPYSFSHRTWELEYQRKQELQKKHPVQSRQKSHNTEL